MSVHCFMPPNKIDHDGDLVSSNRDPPGQSSKYIPPGDVAREIYRRATFSIFPTHVPISGIRLASVGFFYTGYKDRVKCFSCGSAVENWRVGDDVTDKRWHKSCCAMASGHDTENIPVNDAAVWDVFSKFRQHARPLARSDSQLQIVMMNEQISNPSLLLGPHSSVTENRSAIQRNPRYQDYSKQAKFVHAKLANVLSDSHRRFLLTLDLTMESNRRKTFVKWPSIPAPQLPSALAKEGFFFLGNLDRVQCFSCLGVLRNWAPEDDVIDQHRQHFPHCGMVNGSETANVALTGEERRLLEAEEGSSNVSRGSCAITTPPDPDTPELIRLAKMYPCRNAVNPHMASEDKRKLTFDHRWPGSRIRATPEQIAKAGFFFLGDRDRTKCWYCNGGLQNWEPHDEPWTEHAKWFPGCEFVIAKKGPDFVRRIAEAHPNLNRPSIQNPVSYIEPPASSSLIDKAREMGFQMKDIQTLIDRRGGEGCFENLNDLINDILTLLVPSDEKKLSDHEMNVVEPALVVGLGERHDDQEKLKNELKELQNSSLCKSCFRGPANTVFEPCGHLAVCANCAGPIRRCVICKTKVEKSIKIYRV